MRAPRRSLGGRRGPKPRWKVALTAPEYRELQRLARRRTAPHAEVVRARILLLPTSTRSGAMPRSPEPWAARIGRSANGGGGVGRGRPSRTRPGPVVHAFSPSAVRAQVTALACTLPRNSGTPLSRWPVTELARTIVQRGSVPRISGATIQRWLRADRIKPWQYHSWQRPTDPRFLERAIPVLTLYERAQTLARKGHVIVCADEKTSIQARQACGRTTPAHP